MNAQEPTAAGAVRAPERNRESQAVNADHGHPMARLLWDILRDRSVADKRVVLLACEKRMRASNTSVDAKQEQALYAIKLFVDAEGHVPNAVEWDQWRKADPSRRDLPSATFLRNAFNGWTGLRAVLAPLVEGEPVPMADVTVRRLRPGGRRFSDEELLAVLRAWVEAQDGELLRQTEFLAWLRSDLPLQSGLTVWPRSLRTYSRLASSFAGMLRAAGVIPTLGPSWNPSTSGSDPRREAYLDEIRTWAARQSGELMRDEFLAYGRTLNFPTGHPLARTRLSHGALYKLFNGWRGALEEAGLADRCFQPKLVRRREDLAVLNTGLGPELPFSTPKTRAKDWTELGAWVRLAAQETSGAAMSYPEYDAWRKKRMEASHAAGEALVPIPSTTLLKDRAGGSWFTVKELAGVPGASDTPAGGRAGSTGSGYKRQQIIEAVASAWRAKREAYGAGSRVSLLATEYLRWRNEQRAVARAAGRSLWLPTIPTIKKTLGLTGQDWAAVLSIVAAEAEAHEAEAHGDGKDQRNGSTVLPLNAAMNLHTSEEEAA